MGDDGDDGEDEGGEKEEEGHQEGQAEGHKGGHEGGGEEEYRGGRVTWARRREKKRGKNNGSWRLDVEVGRAEGGGRGRGRRGDRGVRGSNRGLASDLAHVPPRARARQEPQLPGRLCYPFPEGVPLRLAHGGRLDVVRHSPGPSATEVLLGRAVGGSGDGSALDLCGAVPKKFNRAPPSANMKKERGRLFLATRAVLAVAAGVTPRPGSQGPARVTPATLVARNIPQGGKRSQARVRTQGGRGRAGLRGHRSMQGRCRPEGVPAAKLAILGPSTPATARAARAAAIGSAPPGILQGGERRAPAAGVPAAQQPAPGRYHVSIDISWPRSALNP